jgi:uncharacterized protein
MSKYYLGLSLALMLVAIPIAYAQKMGGANALTVMTSDGRRHEFKVELALTQPQQMRGLMNRTSLAPDAGMLFFFGPEAERAFWMKNTLIPLDILFLKKDGTIHHIHENATPNDVTQIPSQGPVSAVLEVKGGTVKRLEIRGGGTVHHLLFGNTLK